MIGKIPSQILGIDVGGSAIKGAPVDIRSGKLTAQRIRIETQDKAEPGRSRTLSNRSHNPSVGRGHWHWLSGTHQG